MALPRVWRWQRQLDGGRRESLADIAIPEKLSPSYVSRIARLALLAPDIVEAIVVGSLNQSVILNCLEKRVSVEWEEQKRLYSDDGTPCPWLASRRCPAVAE